MARKLLTDLDLAGNSLNNARVQNLASDPSSPTVGQTYYNTGTKRLRTWNGTTWDEYGTGTGTSATNLAATLSSSNTIITSDTGTDATIPAVDATNAGVMTPTMKGKLDGIEAGADVTDAANVDAAGAVMNSDTSTLSMAFVVDEDNMASNSATKVPTQQSTKAYVDTAVTGIINAAPAALDTLDELAAALGDDANFASTVTTNLAGKMAKASNLSDVANAATAFGNIKQAATDSATGVVELATQAEAQAKTDTTRALTAASVADFARKYTGTIGNGSLTSIPVTHGLGTQYATAQVFDATSNLMVDCDVTLTSSTQTTFTFNTAPTLNQYRVVITG